MNHGRVALFHLNKEIKSKMIAANEWRKNRKVGFEITDRLEEPGFYMKFENGFMVSVQWSSINYGDHYATGKKLPEEVSYSLEVEIAIINPEGELMEINAVDDSVVAYIGADEVAEYMHRVSNLRYHRVTGKVIDPTNLFSKQ